MIAQIIPASGTPFPNMPTKKLLIIGPYTYCRNPMVLGTVVACAGIAVWAGSVIAVPAGAAFPLGYVKLVEEIEPAARFGEEYLE